MKRTFKYLTIAATNVAQPLIGTTLGQAVPISSIPQTILVGDSSIFQQGDWSVLGSSAGGDEERVPVQKVVDATHITIGPTTKAHINGAFIRLGSMLSNLYVQSKDGNVAPLFIGTQGVTTAGVNMEAKIQNVPANQQPTDWKYAFTSDSGPNPMSISEVWITGTVNDQYVPSFGVV